MGRALIFVVAMLASQPAQADSYRDLLIAYRCEVVNRLEQIYQTGDRTKDRDRFIAITVPNHPHGYVQCIFHDNETTLYCEAASGYWYDKPDTPRKFHQSPQTLAALERLGFDMDDSKGNFSRDLVVPDPPDFNAAADFILRALHDGYGARYDTRLQFNVPFAPRMPSTCVPVS